ncbi:MAG: MerR family transcriptional regulator, partial [bacterium]
MSTMYLDDVIEQTGISERNVKYWSQKYDLPVEKDGRKNVYPPRTVTLLELIRLLSDTELFTHHFIRLQVQRALGVSPDEIPKMSDYKSVRKKGVDFLEEIDSALGTKLLPAIQSSRGKAKTSSRRSSRKS